MDLSEKPSNIVIDVAKEAVENIKEAAEEFKAISAEVFDQIGATSIAVLVSKSDETIKVLDLDCKKALVLGLGMVSMGVAIWFSVNIFRSKFGKKKDFDKHFE